MAEPVLISVTGPTVLDDLDNSGGPAVKKTDTGSKSPGKSSRRWVKGSLFKRTLSDQDVSQRADRPPSGKSRARKESHDSLSGDSPTVGRVSSGGDIRSKATDEMDEPDGEKSKFGDPKKLYKQNKELAKQNAQLTKLIETLRHEKESLAIDKSRVKNDLKSTEKELKKVSASLSSARSEVERLRIKSSKHGSGNTEEGVGELQERVRQLEVELSGKDEKLAKFRKTLSSQLNKTDSGHIEDKSDDDKYDLAQQLRTEKETRVKLEGEASELRSRVVNLESDLNQLLELMDGQQREELVLSSSSKEASLLSTFSPDTLSSTEYKHSGHDSPSLCSPSPRNSPALHHGKPSADITNLQTCLQLALEEKKAAEQQREVLQAELGNIKNEMEEAKRVWQEEKDNLLQQLREAHAENDAKQATLDQWKQQHHAERAAAAASTQQTDPLPSPTKTRNRLGSTGSTTGSTEKPNGILKTKKPDTESSEGEVKPEQKKETQTGRRGILKKQRSRENFTAALAVFKTGEASPKPAFTRERSASETSQGSRSTHSSASPAPPLSPRKLSTESRSQSVTVVGKPPIHPQSTSSSGAHSRQSSTDDNSQKSPSRTAKRISRNIEERRKSFEELHESSRPTAHHSRTASSPIMTRAQGYPTLERERESREKVKAVEDKQRVEEEKARKEKKEKQQKDLEAKEKELGEKRRKEAEEKERLKKEMDEKIRKEAEEKERLEKEREEKEERERQERRREREEKRRKEAEEKERLKKEREEKEEREREERKRLQKQREEKRRKEAEERERLRKEKQEKEERERDEKKRLQKEFEEKRKHEEEREQKMQQELEKKRQLEEKKKQEQLELQRAKENEQKAKDAALRRQKDAEEKKKLEERNKRVQMEEERRRTEKAEQAAIEPQPHQIKKRQSPFGSIAMRRAAFEQNADSSPTVMHRNGGKSPTQRPKSMDFAALMSTQSTNSPSLSPTPSSNVSSISIKTSKSPQASPVLNQRKEMKEVPVGKSTTIQKPNPPVTAAPRSATVAIVTTSTSPLLRRAQTISSTPTTLAVSTPDLTSVGMTNSPVPNGGGRSPGAQRRSTVSNATKSPSSERKMAKSVSFSPNLSTANRTSGVPRPSGPPVPNNQPPSLMKFGAVHNRLSVSGAEDMKKAQSLQNIPEHAPADITPQLPTTQHTSHVQRRPRSERAKTTSLSRADTANLTNLISKLQEKEKGPVGNGVDRTVQTRSTPSARPASMYGSITPTRTDVIPRSLPSNKPKPHERRMERRATVGFGLDKSSKKSRLLRWCQLITADYDNIFIEDFSRSFSNGLAFCAMIHHFLPDKIPYSTLNDRDKARNFKIAFEAAESEGIPSLLDIDDMVSLPVPDWMSVMTYISFIYQRFGTNGTTQQFLL